MVINIMISACLACLTSVMCSKNFNAVHYVQTSQLHSFIPALLQGTWPLTFCTTDLDLSGASQGQWKAKVIFSQSSELIRMKFGTGLSNSLLTYCQHCKMMFIVILAWVQRFSFCHKIFHWSMKNWPSFTVCWLHYCLVCFIFHD